MPRRSWAGNRPPLDGAFTINRNSPQANGLVAWIPDSQGNLPLGYNSITASNTSSTVVGDGTLGKVFNLPAGYIELSNLAAGVNMDTAPWSIACWVNFNVVSGTQNIMSLHRAASSFSGMDFKSLSGGAIQCGVGSLSTGVTPVAGTWYRFWYTFSATGASPSSIYLNGVLSINGADQAPSSVVADRLCVGRYNDAGGTFDTLNGKVADIRYYTKCVTPEVIWQDYDPATRYDLWQPMRSRRWFAPSTVVALPPGLGPSLSMVEPLTLPIGW